MKIEKAIIEDYEPVAIGSMIKRIEFTPEQALQLIIGDNGSGKSALLHALSLAPLDKKLFGSNGYRELQVTHQGVEYRLISDYHGKSPKHEFWEGDVNLNPGGTQAIQLELVETRLNYTRFIHRILSGKVSFCSMSPRAREDLLVMISNLDMDYAYKVWDKTRELHRDTQAIVKHLNVKFADMSKSFEMISDAEAIETDIHNITKRLSEVMPHSNFSLDPVTEQKVDFLNREIARLAEESVKSMAKFNAFKKANNLNGFQINSPEHLEGLKISLENKKQSQLEKVKKIKELLDSQADLRQRLEDMPKDSSMEMLTSRLEAVRNQLKEIRINKELLDSGITDWGKHENDLASAKTRFLNLFTDLERGVKFTKEESDKTISDFEEYSAKYNYLVDEIDRTEKAVASIASLLEQGLECDNCGNMVYHQKNISKQRLETGKVKLKDLNEELAKLKPIYDKVKERHTELQEFRVCMKGIHDILSMFPMMRSIFTQFSNLWEIASEPLRFVSAIDRQVLESQRLAEYQVLVGKEQQLLSFIETLKLSSVQQETSFEALEQKMSKAYDDINDCIQQQNVLDKYAQRINDLLGLKEQSFSLEKEYIATSIQFLKDQTTVACNEETRRLQTMLSELNRKLTDYRHLKSNLDNVREEMDTAKRRLEGFNLILKAISPKTGLIGKQLLTVSHSFVTAVNKIVSSIWEKDVLLTTPQLGRNITRFTVAINGKNGPELSELSSGQQDIVDLAVSLVVMSQLGLYEYPLYLDEVGKTFDERHRENLMVFIKNLVISSKCSNVFIVSHYAEQHGGFSNVDVSVLDDSNITVRSENVNRCLLITR